MKNIIESFDFNHSGSLGLLEATALAGSSLVALFGLFTILCVFFYDTTPPQ